LQGNFISATVENVEVFYDGIPAAEYKGNYPVKYSLCHRLKGAETWTFAIANDNGTGTIGIQGKEGNTYEFKTVVEDATEQRHESQIAEIAVPKNEPPTPPVSGGDTSAINGTWHLTSWRGAEPSFDIYLDITDGVVTLYQRLESRAWECYKSSAAMEYGIIKGTYSDGVAWGATYNVSVDVEGGTMTWRDTADSSDISVYTRSELPEDITTTRGAETTGEERFL
jgi:hypothetical protein